MRYRFAACLAVVLSSMLMPWGTATAQPLAQHVPADALVYVGWAGSEAEPDAYLQSTLKQFLDLIDTNRLKSTWASNNQAMIRALDEPEFEEAMNVVTPLFSASWRSPMAMYMLPVQGAVSPDNNPAIVFMWQPTQADRPSLIEALRKVEAEAPESASFSLEATESHVTVSFNLQPSDAELLPDGSLAASLATSEAFTKTLTQLGTLGSTPSDAEGTAPLLTVYVDTPSLVSLAMAAMQEESSPPEAIAVFETLKLDTLGPAALCSGFDGKDWTTRIFLSAPAPRAGLPGLLDAPTLTNQHLAVIPRSATWASAMTFDHGKLMDLIREIATAAGPDAADQFENGLAMLSGLLGTNVEENFIRGLGPAWIAYINPDAVGTSTLGLTLVNPLKDPEGVGQALRTLQALGNVAIAQGMDNLDIHLQFHVTQVGDITLNQLAFPFISPSWTVHKGNLYVGLYPQAVIAAVDQLEAGTSLADRDDFKKVRDRAEPGRITCVSFADLPETAGNAYPTLILIESMITGGTAMASGRPMPMLVPPLSRLAPLLSPMGGTSWIDDDGYHFSHTSPFPGASTLSIQGSTNSMPMMAPMMLGVTAPALLFRQSVSEMQEIQIEEPEDAEDAGMLE